MTSETEIILSFLFKRSGKEQLKASEIYLPLSMDLKWFTPLQAKEFIKETIQQEILTKKGEFLSPNFNYKEIEIPVGFQPSKKIIIEKKAMKEKEETDFFNAVVKRIAEKKGEDKDSVIEKIRLIEKEKNIIPSVASLILGIECNIKVEDLFDNIEKEIFQ